MEGEPRLCCSGMSLLALPVHLLSLSGCYSESLPLDQLLGQSVPTAMYQLRLSSLMTHDHGCRQLECLLLMAHCPEVMPVASVQIVMASVQAAQMMMASVQAAQMMMASVQAAQMTMASVQAAQMMMASVQAAQMVMASVQAAQMMMASVQAGQMVMPPA